MKNAAGNALGGLVGTAVNPALGAAINLRNSLNPYQPAKPAAVAAAPAPTTTTPETTTTAPKTTYTPPAQAHQITQPPTYSAPPPGLLTYPGLVGGLTAAALAPRATNYIQKTADYGAGNIPIGRQAADIAERYGSEIARIGGLS